MLVSVSTCMSHQSSTSDLCHWVKSPYLQALGCKATMLACVGSMCCTNHVQQDSGHLGTITPLMHCQLCDPIQILLEPAGLYSPFCGRGIDERCALCCLTPAMAAWSSLQFLLCLFLLWRKWFLHHWPTPWHFCCPCKQCTQLPGMPVKNNFSQN